jgi:hypothetical protein
MFDKYRRKFPFPVAYVTSEKPVLPTEEQADPHMRLIWLLNVAPKKGRLMHTKLSYSWNETLPARQA